MNPFEKLSQANADYHAAVDEIFLDTRGPAELRAGIKAEFGNMVNHVFNRMKVANDFIAQFYGEQ